MAEFIVGIGSSAGGLEALNSFIGGLKKNSRCTYIIAQHLSPKYESMLTNLLSKGSLLDVVEAKHNEKVEPNKIYVTPPNKNIVIEDGAIKLLTPSIETFTPKPNIDILFFSIAKTKGQKAIGVLLSGTGSDGTKGLMSIKEHGGVSIVQDPNSAKYEAMPQNAIKAKAVDVILPSELIGEEICEITKLISDGVYEFNLPKVELDDMEKIFYMIYKECGVNFSNYKNSTIKRRIQRRMSAMKIATFKDYISYILKNKSEPKSLFQDILIGVTSFFRDRDAFMELYTHLERLITKKENTEHIRIWDIGCSSGEETYSIGIIVYDILQKLNKKNSVQIFATDINENAISQCRISAYSDSSLSEMPKEFKKYIDIKDGLFMPKQEIRDMVVFSRHNIQNDPPFIKLDTIVCRNLLIYFNSDIQSKILHMFHYALNSHSLLFLGQSESIFGYEELFIQLSKKYKIFKKDVTLPSTKNDFVKNSYKTNFQVKEEQIKDIEVKQKISLPKKLINTLGEHLMPMSLVFNEALDVIYIKSTIPYLHVASGEVTYNIYKMIDEALKLELRSLIYKTNKSGEVSQSHFIKVKNAQKEDRYVRMSVIPMSSDEANESSMYVLYFQEEREENLYIPKNYNDGDNIEEIKNLKNELDKSRVKLQLVIEELETTNEELQSSNEELQSSNEELQSSNEELETTNEELQSVNEELEVAYTELKIIANDREQQKIVAQERTHYLELLIEELEEANRAKDEAERIMFQQAKMASMGEMINMIAHQWRQPLNVISLLFDAMEDDCTPKEGKEDDIEKRKMIIMENLEYMSRTINDFRNFFKANTPAKFFDLKTCIEETLSLCEGQLKNLNINIYIKCKDMLKIYGVKNQLKQVIMILIQNGKDGILEKRNELESPSKFKGEIDVEIKKEGDFVHIVVFDNGINIKDEYLAKLGEPYFTTKHPEVGTGIGIYMSKTIISKYFNGDIHYKNRQNGVEATIVIPIIK